VHLFDANELSTNTFFQSCLLRPHRRRRRERSGEPRERPFADNGVGAQGRERISRIRKELSGQVGMKDGLCSRSGILFFRNILGFFKSYTFFLKSRVGFTNPVYFSVKTEITDLLTGPVNVSTSMFSDVTRTFSQLTRLYIR
jgi:hypothetical protein